MYNPGHNSYGNPLPHLCILELYPFDSTVIHHRGGGGGDRMQEGKRKGWSLSQRSRKYGHFECELTLKWCKKVKCEPFISRPWSTRLSRKPQTIKLINISPNLWFMSFFVYSPLIPWHHLQESCDMIGARCIPLTLWLVQDIQMLWYDQCEIHTLMRQSDWCETHTLMQQSDWCEIHTQMRRSDWCKQHTTRHDNRKKKPQKQFKNLPSTEWIRMVVRNSGSHSTVIW